jgi:hypothetical protein
MPQIRIGGARVDRTRRNGQMRAVENLSGCISSRLGLQTSAFWPTLRVVVLRETSQLT